MSKRNKQTAEARRRRRILARSRRVRATSSLCALTLDAKAPAIHAAAGDAGGPARVSILAYSGAPMRVSAWDDPIVVDLATLTVRANMPILRDHRLDLPVGHVTGSETTADGLNIFGVLSAANQAATEVEAAARNGYPWQASIGANPDPASIRVLRANETATVNGREVAGPIRIISNLTLDEVSITAIGADRSTAARLAAQRKPQPPTTPPPNRGETMTFDQWLAANGFDASTLTASHRKVLEAAYRAETNPTPPAPTPPPAVDPTATIRAAVTDAITAARAEWTADAERRAGIQAAAAGNPELAARALAENWDVRRTELEARIATMPRSPLSAAVTREGGPATGRVIEAALAISGGLTAATVQAAGYSADELTEATGRNFRNFGLHALMNATIAAAGRSVPFGTFSSDNIRAAFEADRMLRASGMSTNSMSAILTNLATALVSAGFETQETAWRQVARRDSVKDFKQTTFYSLSGSLEYEALTNDGRLVQGDADDQTYTAQADTYGKVWQIPRKLLINDDTAQLADFFRMRVGMGAALSINKVFWSLFNANTSFFTTARGNKAGSNAVLSILTLIAAETGFDKLTTPDGVPTGLSAGIVLAGPTNAAIARSIYQSPEYRDTTASKAVGTTNPYAGAFTPVKSKYVESATYGATGTPWYLLADPANSPVATHQLVFLNGREVPFIESVEPAADELGLVVRGYHDFGANEMEYRAGYETPGA